ncbi:MAG: DNA helicase RecQ [Candidatus Dadabacteria bacterium]|nr:DNA helicase RecQ [Candidatus Dadabacteria bacterium]NIU88861.1 DNA helicase RecQ [Nitrosopumilaceae archaeon]NIX15813.1 DNA helicase RecQ [Candidatus Dadabacteria bacterium]
MTDKRSLHILKTVFGYNTFRPLQSEIISNLLNKQDTLVIMPTGGGKSLCYQIPGLLFDGLTVVVSPLISLMKDQVEQLLALGVPAVYLNSSLSAGEYQKNAASVRSGKIKLLYVSPETLLTSAMTDLLTTQKIDCLTIDEAHCISDWGHDFRPQYRELIKVRKQFSDAVCIALTATATPRVRKDIRDSLGFDTASEFIGSFDRENLLLRIVPKNDSLLQVEQFLKQHEDESGIIYCFSRRGVEQLTENLSARGFSALPYHAGLSDHDRKHNQELLIRDDVQIIVATIAFGMGINKPNVRFVIHYDLPKNIEGYYQEIGRAGRDGLRAECMLLLGYGDIQKIRFFITQKQDTEQRIANIHLNAMLQFAESDDCRRVSLLKYFGENYNKENCAMCDNCLADKKELEDITIPAQMFLSCVKRTGEIFGANHVVDVLRGSENQKVFNFNHNKLSTYGIGKDYSKKQWLHLGRQFVQKELLLQDPKHGSLKLTKKAYNVLKGNEKLLGIITPDTPKPIKVSKQTDYDQKLFDILRKRRKELADRDNVPPYVVFSDRTLIEMAALFPKSKESLLQIYGVGQKKLQTYGINFLNDITEYCKHKGK